MILRKVTNGQKYQYDITKSIKIDESINLILRKDIILPEEHHLSNFCFSRADPRDPSLVIWQEAATTNSNLRLKLQRQDNRDSSKV